MPFQPEGKSKLQKSYDFCNSSCESHRTFCVPVHLSLRYFLIPSASKMVSAMRRDPAGEAWRRSS